MKFDQIRIQYRNLFILAIAAGMAFVYPVHVVVDHSGLFDHQTHHHDDHHSGEPESDEEHCAFCLTIYSMEVSEDKIPVSKEGGITENIHGNLVPDNDHNFRTPARAPPVYF